MPFRKLIKRIGRKKSGKKRTVFGKIWRAAAVGAGAFALGKVGAAAVAKKGVFGKIAKKAASRRLARKNAGNKIGRLARKPAVQRPAGKTPSRSSFLRRTFNKLRGRRRPHSQGLRDDLRRRRAGIEERRVESKRKLMRKRLPGGISLPTLPTRLPRVPVSSGSRRRPRTRVGQILQRAGQVVKDNFTRATRNALEKRGFTPAVRGRTTGAEVLSAISEGAARGFRPRIRFGGAVGASFGNMRMLPAAAVVILIVILLLLRRR